MGLGAKRKIGRDIMDLPSTTWEKLDSAMVLSRHLDALVLLDQRRLDLKPLITHRVRLEELQSGFEILLDPAGQAVKVVVVMDQ